MEGKRGFARLDNAEHKGLQRCREQMERIRDRYPDNPRPLRLTGLDPAATYRLRLIETPPGRSRAPVALARGPLTLPGAALMGAGVAMPQAWPQTMTVIEGARL